MPAGLIVVSAPEAPVREAQYQNGQWRLIVITAHHRGSTPGVIARRHAYVARRYSKWFDFQAVEDLLGPARGRQVQVKGDKGEIVKTCGSRSFRDRGLLSNSLQVGELSMAAR
jgi:hypothetical protein